MKLNKQNRTKKKKDGKQKLKNVIVITHIETIYSLQCIRNKKPESKSHITKWNNKAIEIGCFDIEKTCNVYTIYTLGFEERKSVSEKKKKFI